MTVSELGYRMSAPELAEWEAYFRLQAAEEEARQRDLRAESGLEQMKARRR